jgi:hypothetical protein
MLCRVVSRIFLFMILPLERKCESDSEAKKSCKIMTLDEKIMILDKYEHSSSWRNSLLIFYFNA